MDFSDIQKDGVEVEIKGMMRAAMIGMLLMVAMGVQAQEKGMKMDLWPNGAMVASSDKEDKAELTVYLPDAKKAT